jgi:long-chain acyl-CoA synthetase
VGRENELIISGGFNIYEKEIETILSSHPDIHEVAVIGVADKQKGEIPKAFIVLKPGVEKKEDAVLNHCRQNLAAYKIPKIEFIKELPKNHVGKIVKNMLPRNL